MHDLNIMGIDGCRAGWFAFIYAHGQWSFSLQTRLSDLLPAHADCERVYIDIPIGLPRREPRHCDQLARDHLKPWRQHSVFSTPTRTAVYAASYAEACQFNQQLTGKKLSKQVWNICAKIRETDQFLLQHEAWCERVYESHPELCFYALNNAAPLRDNKKTAAGQQQRLQLLEKRLDMAGKLYAQARQRYPRGQLAADDILDALVLAIAARHPHKMTSLPEHPPRDEQGLPMRIVF